MKFERGNCLQMDPLDPGRFIMWLMAAVLASCWLLLLIKSTLLSDWYSVLLSTTS